MVCYNSRGRPDGDVAVLAGRRVAHGQHRDVNSRPDVLIVTPQVPYPPDTADRARAFHLVRVIGRYANPHLLSLADGPVDAQVAAAMNGECTRFEAIPHSGLALARGVRSWVLGGSLSEGTFRSAQLATTIQQWAAETRFTAAVAYTSSVAHYIRLAGLEDATKVVDLGDLDSQKWADAAATWPPKSWACQLESHRLSRLERSICSWAHAVVLASESEAAMLRERAKTPNIGVVPNGIDISYYAPTSPGAETGCLFVGSLNYMPNVEGIGWFARAVWPNVRQHWQDVRLTIVGRKPNAAAKDLAEIPGVDVIDHPDDVRRYFDRAAVIVVPMRVARGLQSKVLDGMAAGKPVVASPEALEGFGKRPDLPARPASEAREWVETIHWLLGDQDARHKLGHMGRTFVERFHNWQHCLRPFADLLRLGDPAMHGRAR